jgi:LPXTG-motif cell wall-anchored protein
MKAKNIIFGTLALAIVGAGAYFYFKKKKKTPFSKELTDSLTTTAGVPSTSNTSSTNTSTTNTNASTPDKVLDNAPVTQAQLQTSQEEILKLAQAQSIASQIFTLRSSLKHGFTTDISQQNSFNFDIQTKITPLMNQIKILGYKEVNGLAVKL